MRRIALVGTAPSGVDAPYDDESWEIWGVSARMEYVTRATRWFEIHRLDIRDREWVAKWRAAIKIYAAETPLYMMYPEPDLSDNVRVYPVDHILARFGGFFMTSTFSWMMAMAVDELRPESGEPVEGEIGIWGVDMEHGTEYISQRAGFRHFCAVAKIMDIKVTMLLTTGLVYEPLPYPMWQEDPLINKVTMLRDKSFEHMKSLDRQMAQTRRLIDQNAYAVQVLEEIGELDTHENEIMRESKIEQYKKQTAALVATSAQLSEDIVHTQANFAAHDFYYNYLRP